MKKKLFALPAAVSVLILAWVFYNQPDWPMFWQTLTAAHPLLLSAACLICALFYVLQTWRWQTWLPGLGFGRILFAHITASGLNQLTPGTIAGDGSRILTIPTDSSASLLSATGLEKIANILYLFIWGIAGLLFAPAGLFISRTEFEWYWLPLGLLGSLVSLLFVFILAKYKEPSLGFKAWLSDFLRSLPQVFRLVPAITSLGGVFALSFQFWLCGLATGISLPLGDTLLLFVWILLASSIPITVGGWGIREVLVVYIFSGTEAGLLATSLLFGFTTAVVSFGGVTAAILKTKLRERGYGKQTGVLSL